MPRVDTIKQSQLWPHWTTQEDAALKQLWSTNPEAEVAEALDRSVQACRKRAKRLDLGPNFTVLEHRKIAEFKKEDKRRAEWIARFPLGQPRWTLFQRRIIAVAKLRVLYNTLPLYKRPRPGLPIIHCRRCGNGWQPRRITPRGSLCPLCSARSEWNSPFEAIEWQR